MNLVYLPSKYLYSNTMFDHESLLNFENKYSKTQLHMYLLYVRVNTRRIGMYQKSGHLTLNRHFGGKLYARVNLLDLTLYRGFIVFVLCTKSEALAALII